MKFLSKKWYGIPVIAIFVLLTTGGVAAAYVVDAVDLSATVTESIAVSDIDASWDTIYPNQPKYLTFKVSNHAPVLNDITYTCTDGAEPNASITGFTVGGDDYLNDLRGDDDIVRKNDAATVSIGPNEDQVVRVTITADNGAPKGAEVGVAFNVTRN